MEPKFQSSFIPRGPAASGAAASVATSMGGLRRPVQRDLFSLIAKGLFTLSILLALGVFGYRLFLNYRIENMGRELEAARVALEPETVTELIKLNSRITSTMGLLENHRIVSPVFNFLENATPQTVRYTDFNFNMTSKGLWLTLKGEATNYAALASAADIFNRSSSNFKSVSFSDLQLDTKGNVIFLLRAEVEPTLLSYARFVSANVVSPAPVSTSTPAGAGGLSPSSTSTRATSSNPLLPR